MREKILRQIVCALNEYSRHRGIMFIKEWILGYEI